MALRSDAAGDFINRATNPNGNHTICFWTFPTTVAAGTFRCLYWAGTTVDGTGSESIYMNGDDLEWWAGDDIAARIASVNIMVASTWQFIAAVGRQATGSACELFRGTLTSAAVSLGTGTRAAGGALAAVQLRFGEDIGGAFSNARVANAMMFDSVLTLAQINAQRLDSAPILTPWGQWSAFDDNTGLGLADRSGNARNLTENGTMTQEAHVPLNPLHTPMGFCT